MLKSSEAVGLWERIVEAFKEPCVLFLRCNRVLYYKHVWGCLLNGEVRVQIRVKARNLKKGGEVSQERSVWVENSAESIDQLVDQLHQMLHEVEAAVAMEELEIVEGDPLNQLDLDA